MRLDRRSLLLGAGVSAAGLVLGRRPELSHGIQLGELAADGVVVWTRADRPSRMAVEVAFDPEFRHVLRREHGPLLTPATDGTGELRLSGLPAGRRFHVRVTAHDLDGRGASAPVVGEFRTVSRRREDVRFVWSGDVVGQGWGINPDLGGMTIFSAMAARRPDFFLHSGDTVYSDGPLSESVTLPDGRIWRNLVTPAKSKVAETLEDYRGQFAYNLLDENLRAFAAKVPMLAQWDDHEVVNNWYPGEILNDDRYREKRVDVLAARAFQAFHEWMPVRRVDAVDGRVHRRVPHGPNLDVFVLDMRSYRDANSAGDAPFERILGERQARWLVDSLAAARATWKVIASDMPIGVVVPDGSLIEGVANGRPGVPAGREAELAWVLRELKRRKVSNTVWLTADVHYSAANHYSPERAAVGDFDPFWEFVSGPLHAGAFGPNALDPTFGPESVFVSAPLAQNTSPAQGFQHFGKAEIDGASRELTVWLRDAGGRALWSRTLRPV